MITHILMSCFKTKNTESTERRKTTFPKETVENADTHKAVLNKTMTTQKWCEKYDFVAPLKKVNKKFKCKTFTKILLLFFSYVIR